MYRDETAFARLQGADRPAPYLVLFAGSALRPDSATAELLAKSGIRVLTVADIAGARAACAQLRFDALALDVGSLGAAPGGTIAGLRQLAACPVIAVGTEANEIDEVIALEHGAADYLVRPMSPRLLRAHLMAHLKRDLASAPTPVADEGSLPGGWAFDPQLCQLRRGAAIVPLTERQFSLLRCLAAAPGRVVPRAELEAGLDPAGSVLTARSIDVYVHRLRRRLGEHGAAELAIEAVRRRGYRLQPPPPDRYLRV
ncbi:MAG: response regulator transcription factor [Burkholderiales bacterium]|nr:response regulator transcription factor [Burkholderiales bacterium]